MRAIVKGLVLVVLIPAFYYWLFIFAASTFTGAGHGTAFFYRTILSPFGYWEKCGRLGLIVWPLVGLLLAFRQYPACRQGAMAILAVHYVGIVAIAVHTYSFEWERSGFAEAWRGFSGFMVLFAILYGSSQVFFWKLITKSMPKSRPAGAELPDHGPTLLPPSPPVTPETENPYRSPQS